MVGGGKERGACGEPDQGVLVVEDWPEIARRLRGGGGNIQRQHGGEPGYSFASRSHKGRWRVSAELNSRSGRADAASSRRSSTRVVLMSGVIREVLRASPSRRIGSGGGGESPGRSSACPGSLG